MMRKRCRMTGVILALAAVLMLAGCGGAGGSYDWPDNDMAKLLPEPPGKITSISTTDGESLYADVECSGEEYKDYLGQCKDKGFKEKQDVSQISDSYYYTAYDKDGFKLDLDYYGDSMTISLDAPSDDADIEEETEAAETEAAKPEKTEDAKDAGDSGSGKVSPDFKKTMDGYEDFMDSYVEFMKKYENSSDTASMMADYADMMTKYSDYMEKIGDIDEDELSDADLAYYLKVTARVEKKLAEVAY